MRGIFRSVITIEGAHCVALSNPSAPSLAVSTRNPQDVTSSAKPERSFSSSSTINTFSWLIGSLCLIQRFHYMALIPWSDVESSRYAACFLPGKVRNVRLPGARILGKGSHEYHFETAIGDRVSLAILLVY